MHWLKSSELNPKARPGDWLHRFNLNMSPFLRIGPWLCTCLFGALSAIAALPVKIYVAPTGHDGSSGMNLVEHADKRDGPLQSVQKAIATARELRKNNPEIETQIEFAEGRYEVARPIILTSQDSGLTLASRPGARVEISGGTVINGWHISPTNGLLWQTILPEVRQGSWRFNQLFIDGHRATRARTPNRGYFHAAGPIRSDASAPGLLLPIRKDELPAEFNPSNGGWAVILEKWTDLRLPIRGINLATRTASLGNLAIPFWMDEESPRYWIENTPESLDAPGEWYLDEATGQLSYYAPLHWDPSKSRVTAPRLLELIRVSGDPKNKTNSIARDIHLRGIHLIECDYDLPAQGLISQQTAVPIHGALVIEYSEEGSIENCLFENLGGYGIELGAGAVRWSVIGNRMRSLGAGAIRVGEPYQSLPKTNSICEAHRISDNDLGELGRIFASASGITVYHSGKNRIRHNHIFDLYYTAISIGWTWGYQESVCRDNLVEFNLIEQVGQGVLTDLGGIYTLGPQPGTVIRNNLFREIRSHDYGGWGLYTDEGSTGIVLENNVVFHCKSAGFHQHYGRDNIIRNNLFAFNHDYQLMRTRAEDHRSFVFNRNIVVFDSGELLGSDWSGGTNSFAMADNLYWDTRLTAKPDDLRFGGELLAEWRKRGHDLGSIIADPLLLDVDHPERGLMTNSPAFKMGFQPIDLSKVGVRPPTQRD